MFDVIFKFLAIAALGANALSFVSGKADAVKYDPAPVVAKIASHDTDIAVLQTQYVSLKDTVEGTSKDVKAILQALRPDDYKPAVLDKRIPLVKGADANGPINEN